MVLTIGALAALTAAPAHAAAPEKFGPQTYEYSFIAFHCDGFDLRIEGAGVDRATVFFDTAGDVLRVAKFSSFPHDVVTNTVTGHSIVVRAQYQEFSEPVAGGDEWIKTFVGSRYLANDPGVGATIREVGKISFADIEQTIVTFVAGQHDVAFDDDLWPVFCGALA